MRSKLWNLAEIVGLTGIAVAVGMLAGGWWGVLAGSVEAVVFANLADDTPAGDA